MQGAAVYVPGVTGMFGTTPLSVTDVMIALVLSVTVWGVGEAEKRVRRFARPSRAG